MKVSARGELLDILDLKISDSLQIYNADCTDFLFDSQPTPPNK